MRNDEDRQVVITMTLTIWIASIIFPFGISDGYFTAKMAKTTLEFLAIILVAYAAASFSLFLLDRRKKNGRK